MQMTNELNDEKELIIGRASELPLELKISDIKSKIEEKLQEKQLNFCKCCQIGKNELSEVFNIVCGASKIYPTNGYLGNVDEYIFSIILTCNYCAQVTIYDLSKLGIDVKKEYKRLYEK